MAASEKTISSLVSSQLPDFINGSHPQFTRFLELYYTWLEKNSANGISNTAGNTIYHAEGIENYRDVDQTPDEFIKYFIDELIPSFPQNTVLDKRKIIKAAREFYSKKGSEESIRWLFKVLYNEDIEINYPKEQILITSDGKWIQPKAFRITVSESNKNLNPNLLEKRLVLGTVSGATCIVESANRNIDPTNGKEVLEIYISNIKRLFNNGETIQINYIDENGVARVFLERIIGTISNIRVDSNIRTDPTQRRRGLFYNVGDPVVITGGLGRSAEANDAAAIVGNVSLGSIEAVNLTFPGYGYRLYTNTEVIVLRSSGDDENANQSTDLRVLNINFTQNATNSQQNFFEQITYDRTVIEYLADTEIGNANLAVFTLNTINMILNVTENDQDDDFNNFEQVWANGTNFNDALFTARIATINGNTQISGTVNVYSTNTTVWGSGTLFTGELKVGQKFQVAGTRKTISSITNNEHLVVSSAFPSTLTNQNAYRIGPFGAAGGFGTACTDGILLYDVSNTGSIATIFGGGQTLNSKDTNKSWIFNSLTSAGVPANANSMICQTQDLVTENTGGIGLISVINGGAGFRSKPTLNIQSHYDTQISTLYNYESQKTLKKTYWQTFKDLGYIAHVYINNGGTSYSVNDPIRFEGRGYGGNGYVQSVAANGAITSVVLTDRGEGYSLRPNVIVGRASPTYTALVDGTVNVAINRQTVIGTGTYFIGNVSNNDIIRVNSQVRQVVNLVNNGYLIVNTAFTSTATGQTLETQDGTEAVLTGYLFGDGERYGVDTSAIGRVKDIRLLYRGYDYVGTPLVSLKIADTVINPLPESNTFTEQEYVYQGANLAAATFKANVKSYSRSANTIRLYNYSGTINTTIDLKSSNGVYFNVNTLMNVAAPAQYPASVITTGLPNPMYYGNGRAKAIALFANGLIEFTGFFLNADGFPSADKVLQDGDIYHNFSYIVQSEKSLLEYENSIKNIIHPTGLKLVAKTLLVSENENQVEKLSNVDFILSRQEEGTANVQVINSYANVVTGNGTIFLPAANTPEYANCRVNIGDMIIIDDGVRIPIAKIISNVVSNTSLEVEGDFIYAGQGLVSSNLDFSQLSPGTVTTNPPVTGTVTINPAVTGTVTINAPITGTVNVSNTSNVVIGNNSTAFTGNLIANDIIIVNNQIRKVISITNNKHLIVNTAFSYPGTDNTAYSRSNLVIGSGTTFNTNVSVGDVITINGEVRAVVNVISDTLLNVNSVFLNYGSGNSLYNQSNVVIGSGTNFDPQVNVGDIITINNEIREVTVRSSDTYLEVNAKFSVYGSGNTLYKANTIVLGSSTTFNTNLAPNNLIKVNNEIREVITVTDGTHITINSPFTYYQTGANVFLLSNTVLRVSGNINSVVSMVQAGDNVTFNIAAANLLMAQTGTVQVFTTNGKVIGTSTSFTSLNPNDVIMIHNQIKQVINIASATVMNVNGAFSSNTTGKLYFKRAARQNANVVSVSANQITLNIAYGANVSNLVYLVIPNLRIENHGYNVVTLTAS